MASPAILNDKVDVPVNPEVMNRIAAPSGPANFLIDADHAGVKNYTKSGDDLIIEFADGKIVRIESFFAHGADYNNLVFVQNGGQWVADFSHAQDGDGLELNATHGMIGESSSAQALLGVLAVAAVGGGIAVAASGGGNNGGSKPLEPPAKPNALTIGSVWDDTEPTQSVLNRGDSTNDTTPTLRGTGVPGETINVYDNGVFLGSTTVNSHGNWLFTPSQPLAEVSMACMRPRVRSAMRAASRRRWPTRQWQHCSNL